MAKLSRALQTKHQDLSLISSLVDAALNSLDDAILPSENWVLQLRDAREELKAATDIEVTHLDICSIQERVGKPFIRLIKDNIYPTGLDPQPKDVLSALSIFYPKKVSSLSTHELPLYGDSSIQTLIGQFGRDLPAKLLNFRRQPLSLLTSAQSEKRIISSAVKRCYMHATEGITPQWHAYSIILQST